jgi:hypothetical protein
LFNEWPKNAITSTFSGNPLSGPPTLNFLYVLENLLFFGLDISFLFTPKMVETPFSILVI